MENNEEKLKQSEETNSEQHQADNNENEFHQKTLNDCGCQTYFKINYIPNEYFYNSCDCEECQCSSEDEMVCSCSYSGIQSDLNNYDNCTCHD